MKVYRNFYYLQKLCVEKQGIGRLRVVVTLSVQVAQLVQVPEMTKHNVIKMSQNQFC